MLFHTAQFQIVIISSLKASFQWLLSLPPIASTEIPSNQKDNMRIPWHNLNTHKFLPSILQDYFKCQSQVQQVYYFNFIQKLTFPFLLLDL